MCESKKEATNLLEEVLTKEQIGTLDKMGFFVCPASSNKHLSEKGGLCRHSLNVTKRMIQMNEGMRYGIKREWVLLMGLLHDLVKVSMGYEENLLKNGQQSESKPYSVNAKFDLGHGSGSVYLIISELGVKLPVPVATAIIHHMGFEFPRDRFAVNTIQKNPVDMLCVLLLQHADQLATWVDEVKY